MKTIGIIGGLGPMATVYFMELIIKMTDVKADQEHIRIYLQSLPDTPDRTDYICGKSDKSPLPYLVNSGISLAEQGADFIAIPCVTAQYFYKDLADRIPIPVMHLVAGLVEEIKGKGIRKIGVLATNGTIQSGILQSQLTEAGIAVILPDKAGQDSLMDIIYNQIKAGKAVKLEQFHEIGNELLAQGAERVILGCTELSLIKRDYPLNNAYIDVLDILAKNAIIYSGAPLKQEYQHLV